MIQPDNKKAAAEDALIEREFQALLAAYLSSNHRRKVEVIERAYRFAKAAHKGVRRRSGEPYILHPIAVARIVISELGLGSTSICAALLHDVVEDTEFTREDIEANFGPKVADIVEGLTKISGGIFGDKASLQAENFRKLLLSMSTDIRVVLIKMADRLHNMRTLSSMRPEKQLKIAGETLYIYAPLAHRLGLYKIKDELEDLAFRYEHPKAYAEIMAKVNEGAAQREEIVEKFVAPVREKLDAAGFRYEIKARVKSAYSIFKKMEKKKIPFEEVYDIYAVRVIFDNDDDDKERVRCWEVYTFFSDTYAVHPDRLRDWTSTPKANGYRALHLTAMGPDGRWIEVQIRSRKMDEIAELGYAAHWKYKAGVSEDETDLDRWMNTIKDILANPEPNAIDFLDTIKLNLFSSEIYVFTPKGDLVTLPARSTVLDLAFAIHTQLGMHCIAGKINHRLVPISHPLDSGDQVEIITSDTQRPAPSWLRFCHSARALNRIRVLLRKDRDAMVAHGRTLFGDFLARENIKSSPQLIRDIVALEKLDSEDDLYYMMARDELSIAPDKLKKLESQRSSLLKKVLRNPFASRRREEQGEEEAVSVKKGEIFVLHPGPRANYRTCDCCNPIPGDDVVGFFTEGRGVEVHKVNCPEAMKLKSAFGRRIVSTAWGERPEMFTARIAVDGLDRFGLLGEMAVMLADKLKVNVREMTIRAEGEVFDCSLTIMVDGDESVRRICRAVKNITGVRDARRIE